MASNHTSTSTMGPNTGDQSNSDHVVYLAAAGGAMVSMVMTVVVIVKIIKCRRQPQRPSRRPLGIEYKHRSVLNRYVPVTVNAPGESMEEVELRPRPVSTSPAEPTTPSLSNRGSYCTIGDLVRPLPSSPTYDFPATPGLLRRLPDAPSGRNCGDPENPKVVNSYLQLLDVEPLGDPSVAQESDETDDENEYVMRDLESPVGTSKKPVPQPRRNISSTPPSAHQYANSHSFRALQRESVLLRMDGNGDISPQSESRLAKLAAVSNMCLPTPSPRLLGKGNTLDGVRGKEMYNDSDDDKSFARQKTPDMYVLATESGKTPDTTESDC